MLLLLLAAALFDLQTAERFARLALDCVAREYPNKIAHVLNSDSDVAPPRQLTPAFYGCYDWHSSVHGHWLLARLARTFPDASFTPRARQAVARSLTLANIQQEVRYLQAAGRASFERPYGLAWLLQLGIELREWETPEAKRWSTALEPLERAAAARLKEWLPKLSHPVRPGEHSQSAFAPALALDWARGGRPGVSGAHLLKGPRVLPSRSRLPAPLRTLRRRFPVPLPERGRRRAPCPQANRIRRLAGRIPSGHPAQRL